MDPIYGQIYSALYAAYQSVPTLLAFPPAASPFSSFLAEVQGLRLQIERKSQDVAIMHNRFLRADAKHVLLVNFSEMILRPIIEAGRIPLSQIRPAVDSDLDTIIGAAEADPTGEVSAHRVIDALSTTWTRLTLTKFDVWE